MKAVVCCGIAVVEVAVEARVGPLLRHAAGRLVQRGRPAHPVVLVQHLRGGARIQGLGFRCISSSALWQAHPVVLVQHL